MDKRLPGDVEDQPLAEDIDLLGDVIAAAASSTARLSEAEVDEALGLTPATFTPCPTVVPAHAAPARPRHGAPTAV